MIQIPFYNYNLADVLYKQYNIYISTELEWKLRHNCVNWHNKNIKSQLLLCNYDDYSFYNSIQEFPLYYPFSFKVAKGTFFEKIKINITKIIGRISD